MTDCFQTIKRAFAWLFGIQIREIHYDEEADPMTLPCTPEECMCANNMCELNVMLGTIKDEHERIVTEVDWFLKQEREENLVEGGVSSDCESETSYDSYSSSGEEEGELGGTGSLVPY